MPTAFSHFSICVSDLERSTQFYCEGLDCTASPSAVVGSEWSPHTGLPGTKLEVRMLTRDDIRFELLHFHEPGVFGEGSMRAMNQLGITHMAFEVDDVSAAAATLERLGGRYHADSLVVIPRGDQPDLKCVYCSDPDGVRVRLSGP